MQASSGLRAVLQFLLAARLCLAASWSKTSLKELLGPERGYNGGDNSRSRNCPQTVSRQASEGEKWGFEGGRDCRAPGGGPWAGRAASLGPTKPGFGCIQDVSKTAQDDLRGFQDHPKNARETPKTPSDTPKTTQDAILGRFLDQKSNQVDTKIAFRSNLMLK